MVIVIDARIRSDRMMWLEVTVNELGVLAVLGARMDMLGGQQRHTEQAQRRQIYERPSEDRLRHHRILLMRLRLRSNVRLTAYRCRYQSPTRKRF